MAKFRRSARLGPIRLAQQRKKKVTPSYHLRNIQTLLTQGFTAQELRELCFYEAEFRPVYDRLPHGVSKNEIIRQLLEFAEQRLLLDLLLDLARKHNPARYEQHQPYILPRSRRTPKANS